MLIKNQQTQRGEPTLQHFRLHMVTLFVNLRAFVNLPSRPAGSDDPGIKSWLPLSSSSYVRRMFLEKPSSYWGPPFFRNPLFCLLQVPWPTDPPGLSKVPVGSLSKPLLGDLGTKWNEQMRMGSNGNAYGKRYILL